MDQLSMLDKVYDMARQSAQKQLTPDAGMMRVVCAHCKRDMGQKMGPTGLVTHGICKPCLEKVEAPYDQKAMLGFIAGHIYQRVGGAWINAVDSADAAMTAMDDLGLLRTGQITSPDETRAHKRDLLQRGPLTVELAENA